MEQFDWLLALSLVRCMQLMEQFDWLIPLGLITSCRLAILEYSPKQPFKKNWHLAYLKLPNRAFLALNFPLVFGNSVTRLPETVKLRRKEESKKKIAKIAQLRPK